MTNHTSELIDRAKAKQKEIEAKIHLAKADAKGASNERVEKLENDLDDLKGTISEATSNATESVARKLNEWLK